VIERRRRVQNGPWVFHRDGWPIRDFRAAWKSALEKAEVKEYRFHDFRRTATRNMALAGVPEKHIMQVTGHKTTAMLDRYNITVEQDTYNTLTRTQEFLKRAQSRHIAGADKEDEQGG
jgi:integrase